MKFIPFFRAGSHLDSQDRPVEFSEADLDAGIVGYDPALHRAPLVIRVRFRGLEALLTQVRNCAQGIGSITKVQSAAQYLAQLKREHAEAKKRLVAF